jgi:threonine/homoserine/homoserine lactone efflux protein
MAFLPLRDRTRIVLLRWPAIVAGLSVALGIHIVLTAFGLGVVFLQSQSAEGGSSMATAALLLWSGLSWVTAAFIGGYITAWVADASRYIESLFHGLVLWGALTFILMFLPPSTMGISAQAEAALSPSTISSVARFVAIGGLLSLGTTIWGAVIGSRVVAEVETKETGTYRAA